MTDDDLTRTTSSIDTRLTRLTWTVNLWGGAITILLVITLLLSATTIRGHGPWVTNLANTSFTPVGNSADSPALGA